MSLRAILWALNEAPVDDPTDALILVAYADNAHEDGTGSWPSMSTVAGRARCSVRTVQRRLPALVAAGVLRPGDQRLVEHLDKRYRPTVYDLVLTATRGDILSGSTAAEVTPESGSGDTTSGGGVTPPSYEPSRTPRDEPVPLFAEAAPPPSAAGAKPESRTQRVNRLARHVCDSSPEMKARGFHRWRESFDALVTVEPDADDERLLDALRQVVRAGLALTRENAIRSLRGELTVGRRVDNRHRDEVAADDPEQQARRAAWS
jgi:hypothetical protein